MPSRRIPCTLLLPLFSLTLFVVLVALPATLTYIGLHQLTPPRFATAAQQHLSVEQTLISVAASEPKSFANLLNGIDMPANFVELPIDKCSSAWPDTWYPPGLSVFTWRAISFPFYSLPFWWFAGFGLDILLKRRHSRWPVLLVGTLVFALFALLAVMLSLTHGVEDDRAVTIPIRIGEILWTLLFASFPAAWIRRRLERLTIVVPEI